MNELLTLLDQASEAIPRRGKINKEQVQDFLAARMVDAIRALASDYVQNRDSLSERSRAVLARATLEGMFLLLGAMHSVALAVNIIYTRTEKDLRYARQMKDADPNPKLIADTVIIDLEDNLSFIKKTFSGITTKCSLFSIAESVGCITYYRSYYFSLSQYVHSNYATLAVANSESIQTIAETSVILACCVSAEEIAKKHSHPEQKAITQAARHIYQTRSGFHSGE